MLRVSRFDFCVHCVTDQVLRYSLMYLSEIIILTVANRQKHVARTLLSNKWKITNRNERKLLLMLMLTLRVCLSELFGACGLND